MKKENFKYLYSFKYSNKEYIYLLYKNYLFYFLEYNSNADKCIYPEINTFKELYNKFFCNDEKLALNIPSYTVFETNNKSQKIYNYFKDYKIDVTDKEYDGGSISYNFEETERNYKNNVENLRDK